MPPSIAKPKGVDAPESRAGFVKRMKLTGDYPSVMRLVNQRIVENMTKGIPRMTAEHAAWKETIRQWDKAVEVEENVPVSLVESYEWVLEALGMEGDRKPMARHAPSAGTWAVYEWATKNDANRKEFMKGPLAKLQAIQEKRGDVTEKEIVKREERSIEDLVAVFKPTVQQAIEGGDVDEFGLPKRESIEEKVDVES